MPEKIFELLSGFNEVEAVALGGSRSGGSFDESSDYDVYAYLTSPLDEEKRRTALSEYCGVTEIGNSFWEYEDNCVLKNGCGIDIIYRSLDEHIKEISRVVDGFEARNGYTTCMWHNLITSRIIFDRNGRLEKYKRQYTVPYPERLRSNIISRNMRLLRGSLPNYTDQIKKAANRRDLVSVNHRTAEFMASYFDVIFALNRMTHPGEKRLVSICLEKCGILPADFEKNINSLFSVMTSFGSEPQRVVRQAEAIAEELEKTVNSAK
ncbi:MAG: DUF4037 domain-containing protein [Ruminococcus sp.]|nr:DUF4037 domain-containing protein [Ruminococcus sp.]